MRGPDFVLAGGHKCATTTLHALLDQHPAIAMSLTKEPHFLARSALKSRLHAGVWDPEAYARLWPSEDDRLRGESSVLYLSFADAVVQTIEGMLDDKPRVVLSLRDPVERAFSCFVDSRLTNPQETAETFRDAVDRELQRGPARLDGAGLPTLRHLALGFYSQGIETLMGALGEESVHVVLFEDFRADPARVWDGILDFLGVPPMVLPAQAAMNTGGKQWRPGMASRLTRSPGTVALRRALGTVAPSVHAKVRDVALRRLTEPTEAVDQDTRSLLRDLYADETARLEGILGRSLAVWSSRR